MHRENRYTVIKNTDINRYLSFTEIAQMELLFSKVTRERLADGRGEMRCVVVEHNWPEYEPTWKSIENRVDNDNLKQRATALGVGLEVTDLLNEIERLRNLQLYPSPGNNVIE